MNPTEKSNEQQLSQLMDGEWHELNPADCVAALCDDNALHAKWSRYHIIRDVLKNEPIQANPLLAASICKAIQNEPAYSNITPFNATASASGRAATSRSSSADLTTGEQRPVVKRLPAVVHEQTDNKPSWVNTGVAGFAVAASVALVTVVGLNLTQQQDQSAVLAEKFVSSDNSDVAPVSDAVRQNAFVTQAQIEQASLPVVEFVANTGPFWMSPESSTRVSDEARLNMMLSHHIENSPTAVREGLLPYSRLVGYEESGQSR